MMARKSVIKFHVIVLFFGDEPKLIKRGENAVESGHVKTMIYDADFGLIKGDVDASMKDKSYSVQIALKENGEIESAECTCPRGQVRCHHMAALLIHCHHNISVTDAQCSWSVKRVKNVETVKTVSELFPSKEYRATTNVTQNVKQEVYDKLSEMNSVVGFSWLLGPEPASTNLNHASMEDIIFSNEFQSSQNKYEFLKQHCSLNEQQISDIANETKGQAANWKWGKYRNFRLTASNFGIVLAACRRNSFPPSLFKTLMGNYCLDGVKSVQWGKQHEKTAVNLFEIAMKKEIQSTGLWLHPSGLLGATPDGFVIHNDRKEVVEVKCPFKYRDSVLSEALKGVKNYVLMVDDNGMYSLNKSHNYYHQIQGQIYLTNSECAHLIVWTPQECVIFPVSKDLSWNDNLHTLSKFYVDQYIPWVLRNH